MTDERFTPQIQVPPDHYKITYDDKRRWTSYWIQIQLASPYTIDGTILEVGVGNRVVSTYLRQLYDASITTVDIDHRLEPDVVADIAELPFSDDSFNCAIACQVLEHMPFERACIALTELSRVSANAIISVPNANKYYFQLHAYFGSRRRRLLTVDFSKLFPKRKLHDIHHEHYWELNRDVVSTSSFRLALTQANWQIVQEFRNPDFPYHHFFYLKRCGIS